MGGASGMYPNLSDQAQFRLKKINEIKHYFIVEINEGMSKILNKYIAAFDFIDKALFDLSATSGGMSIAPFASVIGVPVEIASASFSSAVFITTGIVKKLLKTTVELYSFNNSN